MPGPLRVGAVSYLNTRPLVLGFEQGLDEGRIELSYDVPARLADAMRAGSLDAALLPVIELAFLPEMEILPGLSISCRGPARSVLVVAKRPWTEVKTVALDPESRTSNALARLLLSEVPGPARRFAAGPIDLDEVLAGHDAAVRIGDKALFDPVPAEARVLDLGDAWTARTGLPFVFAVWAVRRGAIDAKTYRLFHRSFRAGRAQIDRIAADYAWHGVRRPDVSGPYLRDHMRYRLGAEEFRAMRRFLAEAASAGIVGRVPDLRLARWRETGCDAIAVEGAP